MFLDISDHQEDDAGTSANAIDNTSLMKGLSTKRSLAVDVASSVTSASSVEAGKKSHCMHQTPEANALLNCRNSAFSAGRLYESGLNSTRSPAVCDES